MSCCVHLAPKKFLCCLPLRKGSMIVGVIMILLTLILTIVLAVESSSAESYNVKDNFIRFGLGCIIAETCFAVLMLIMHIVLLIGIIKKKASMIISWVSAQSIWLAHKAFILLILLLLFLKVATFTSWLFALVFGFIGMMILIYFVLVVYGYWLQLKAQQSSSQPAP